MSLIQDFSSTFRPVEVKVLRKSLHACSMQHFSLQEVDLFGHAVRQIVELVIAY